MEWGIFSDESAEYTADEAVEADFYSLAEAETAMKTRYTTEDDLHVHVIEEAEEDEEAEGDEGDEGDEAEED